MVDRLHFVDELLRLLLALDALGEQVVKWRDRVPLDLRLYLILVDDLLD